MQKLEIIMSGFLVFGAFMRTERFLLLLLVFVALMLSYANAQLETIAKQVGVFIINDIKAEREVKKISEQEIMPVYEDWFKSLEKYISEKNKVGDCKTIGSKYIPDNKYDSPSFSYNCGIRDGIAFLHAKNKIKIGNCAQGSELRAEFDIKNNYLDVFSFPANAACAFFQPSCRTLISGSCPPDMVFVGAGTFTMGCERTFTNFCDYGDSPLRNVTLNSFCISKYEVTQKEWQEVMGSNPSKFKNCGSNCPVEQVSWNEVQTFIRNLNAKTKRSYRLPTEAEWEYAARGGCKASAKVDKAIASGGYWCSKNSNNQTHAIGTLKPNSMLNVYDMSGNVWEWVSDYFGVYNKSDVNNPKGPGSGSKRVARGGAWSSPVVDCRITNRGSETPDTRKDILGFRLVHPPIEKAVETPIQRQVVVESRELNQKAVQPTTIVSQNTAGSQPSGKTELGGRRGAPDGGFNAGYAEGSSGGLGGLIGGGSIGKTKGGIKAPSAKDIDVANDNSRSRAEIMAVINQHINGLKSIYDRYLKNKPGFIGKVALKFTVAPSGDITSINITSSTTRYPDFDNAIKDQVSKWKWKAINSGNSTATVPFEFAE